MLSHPAAGIEANGVVCRCQQAIRVDLFPKEGAALRRGRRASVGARPDVRALTRIHEHCWQHKKSSCGSGGGV